MAPTDVRADEGASQNCGRQASSIDQHFESISSAIEVCRHEAPVDSSPAVAILRKFEEIKWE